ncbi:DUF2637 domain-containing protein [Nocardia sp. 2]|uniref:DUF2637 domain-containing protein n=1 Tax=Nocardia acididurans TaxID=2802282 RepID=A0ABS1MFR3_9NOCA|nr:DUF2637 domain-containing protein [Nocardia acididurans]MBL1079497.1 DUF2637 domain-containing protein [Nocardia acididurans]
MSDTDTTTPVAPTATVAPDPVEPSPAPAGLSSRTSETKTGDTRATTAAEWNVAEAVALLAVAAVSVAAFGWSAIALHGLAQGAGITSWLAWGAPVIVDGPIVQAAFALVTLRRRERAGVAIPKGTYRFFWGELAVAELISLIGNAAHATMVEEKVLSGLAAAAVAGAAPVAALGVTHALTTLLEVPRAADPCNLPAGAEIAVTRPVASLSPADTEATTGDNPGDGGDDPGDAEATAGDAEATAPGPEATAERDAYIWARHQAGHSTREIGAEVGLHHGTIAKIVTRQRTEHRIADTEKGGGADVLSIVR